MSVTVHQGAETFTSTEDSAEAVLSSLSAIEAATPPETPAPSPAAAVESADAETQTPDAAEGPAPVRARDESGRFTDAPPAKAAKPEPAEKRIAKITWEREEAKRQHAAEKTAREALEARLAALEKGQTAQPAAPAPAAATITPKTDGEPQLENFESYESYTRALARWEVRQELAEQHQQREQQTAQTKEQQRLEAHQQRQAAWNAANPAKVAEVSQGAASQRLSPAMVSAILDSEHGPEVLHFLATHPEECLQLVAETQDLAPTAAPVVRRALERFIGPSAASTAQPKAPTRSPAPAPIQPVGASPLVPETDSNALDGWAYVNAENNRELARMRMKQGLMK